MTPPATSTPPQQWWTTQDCATHTGVAPSTWRSYVARGQAPAPVRHIGRTPLWDPDQVRAWAATRPGRGWWGPHPTQQTTP